MEQPALQRANLTSAEKSFMQQRVETLHGMVGRVSLAVSETVILLHPPLTSVGVSIGMERERQQNDSLADG